MIALDDYRDQPEKGRGNTSATLEGIELNTLNYVKVDIDVLRAIKAAYAEGGTAKTQAKRMLAKLFKDIRDHSPGARVVFEGIEDTGDISMLLSLIENHNTRQYFLDMGRFQGYALGRP